MRSGSLTNSARSAAGKQAKPGQNQYCQVLCNPLYTAYRTTATKDRCSVIDTLANWEERRYRITPDALAYLDVVGVAQ